VTTPLGCLLFFAAWTLGLVLLGIGPYRIGQIALGKASPRAFPADQPHGPDTYRRLLRAHANCVENLPVFAAVVLTGMATHTADAWPHDVHHRFGVLAIVYVCARVAQSAAHIVSGRSIAIYARFGFFVVQLVTIVWMGLLVALRLANR
jgi:uncharacterized MAPEG superfamily protein